MKKVLWLLAAILSVVLLLTMSAVAADSSVQLFVNGSSASPQEVVTSARTLLTVQAPGATGVRILDPNRYDSNNEESIENQDCWEYYERDWNLAYLEVYQNFDSGSRFVYAEARYDNYDNFWAWQNTDTSPWTVKSNQINLTLTSNGKALDDPQITLSASSVARGEWLYLQVQDPLNVGEWYWGDLNYIDDQNDEHWRGHYNFNEKNELAISTAEFEAGSYILHFCSCAPGYATFGHADATFSITGNESTTHFLMLNKTEATVGEEIFISAYSSENKRLEITKNGRPDWFEKREWDEGYAKTTWKDNEPGTYFFSLRNRSGTEIASQTVTLTMEDGKGQLSKPNLSRIPAMITKGQAYSGTFTVDNAAKWVDINVSYIPDNGNWEKVYQCNRQTTDENYNTLSLPASVLSKAGKYKVDINTSATGYENHNTGFVFLVKETESAGSPTLTLTVNGSTNDSLSWPSSKNVQIQVQGEGATAIRLLRDENWEDVEGWTNGTVNWQKGFGDGDHILVAQMTKDEPQWREDGFDWSQFNWNEDVNWTTLSNPVKIHVESLGALTEPIVTLKVGNQILEPSSSVTRGDVLTVTAAEQTHAEWVWAEVNTLRSNDDGGRWFESLENGHFDSSGHHMTLKVPTAGIPAGNYYLQVGVDAENWDGRDTYVPFTIVEPASGTVAPGLEFSQESMQANEGISILAWAPGASRMELDIIWDRDPNWRDHRDTGRDSESWGWGCGSGGTYTFTLTYFMPNQSTPGTIVKTLTVTSSGSLEQPKFNDIPDILSLGNGIQGSFTTVEGTEWYNVGIRYSYNGYDWDDIFNEDRHPDQENVTSLNFSNNLFAEEGLYQLWVSANALGKDNGYNEKRIQVLDTTNVSNDLVLRVNGQTDGSKVREVYLHMEPDVSVSAPSNVTAVRMINSTSDWQYRIPDENGMVYCNLGVHQGGNVIFRAQATTDTAVATWANNHNGDMDGFNWESLDWSISAMPVVIDVIYLGDLDNPEIIFPNGNSVERGTALVFTISPVAHSDYYGYRIRKVLANGLSGYILDNDINMTETSTIRIPTDALTAGTYRLDVDPRRYGWHGNEIEYRFTVTENNPANTNVFTVEKLAYETLEPMKFSIYAPGASRIKLCHENEANVWSEMDGDTMIRMVIPNRERTYHVMAYKLMPNSNVWEQINNTLEITVTAPNGDMPAPIISAPASVQQGQPLIVLLTCDYLETYGSAECWLTVSEDEEYRLEQFNRLMYEDGTYAEFFRLDTSHLSLGKYTIEGFAFPGAQGYRYGYGTTNVTVSATDTQATLTVDKYELEIFEDVHLEVAAQGATAIALYEDGYWVYETGASIAEDITGWWDGEMTFFAYYSTAVLPNDDSWMNPGWSGWTGISNLVRVYVNPPTHELDELTFTVDKTTVQRGEKFRITITSSNEGLNPSYGATLQRLEEGGQYGSSNPWYGPVSEDSNIILVDTRNIEPGDYLLHVTASAIGCHGQNKDVTVHVTAAVNTLILPSGLTVIKEEAFAGVAAQKIIVPEGVTTIESRAFAGCPNLVEIELPAGISSFAGDAFAQCTNQVKVYGPADSYLADYATQVNNLVLEPTD